MASLLYPHIGFLLVAFWALSALAFRTGAVRDGNRTKGAAAVLALSLAISFVPVGGLSLSGLALSFIPAFSGGSIFLVLVLLSSLWLDKDSLSEREWLALLIGGVLYSLVLIISSLGIIPFDLYAAGYGQRWFIALLAICASVLALTGSALSLWLIAAPALWLTDAVPSGNMNDSLTDCFFLALCMVLLIKKFVALRKQKAI